MTTDGYYKSFDWQSSGQGFDYHYYIFNKPYGVLSQFTREVPQHVTLQDYLSLPQSVYPIGRLDKDSEGLLLLTDDNRFKSQMLDPKSSSTKTYWVQVEGEITPQAILQLSKGVDIKLKSGIYRTKSCSVYSINPALPDREPPVRTRLHIPTSWIEITLTEGKNRQIRKMCAAVGYPCLRLVRVAIQNMRFVDVSPGQYRKITLEEVKQLRSA